MSNNGTSGSLEARVQRLESELAALHRGRIEARELQLVDDEGRLVASFTATKTGPSIQLYDRSGTTRAKLEVDQDLPSLTMLDPKGNTRAWLGFSKDAIRVGFADEQGNSRAFFGVHEKGGPTVRFYDAEQSAIWSAPGADV